MYKQYLVKWKNMLDKDSNWTSKAEYQRLEI
jgi:hypothetical protein